MATNRTVTVVLYQLEDGSKNLFRSFDIKKFNMLDYEIVYECERPFGYTNDDAFDEFNNKLPANFTGRSMSTSDVIGIGNNMYYCNTAGWIKLQERFYV